MTEPRPAERFGRLRVSTTVLLRFLVSLALALLLWGWVSGRQDPVTTGRFNEIPIEAPELESDLEVFTPDLGFATVWLEGPSSIIGEIDERDLEARLDLGGVDEPGDYAAEVTLAPPVGTRLERIQPRTIPVHVDRRLSRTVRLEPEVEQPEDGTRQVGTPQPEVSEVVVGGPEQRVESVARVVLPIEIGNRTDDFSDTFLAEARAADGAVIPDVTIQPGQVSAAVPVQARGRSVPVLIQTAGNPAEGYEVVDNASNPATVLIDGPPELLDDVVSVETEPVEIRGATEQVTRLVGLDNLPPEIRVVDPPSGQVFAVIQVRQRGTSQRLEDLPVVVNGLGPGLEAVVEPRRIDVVVFADDETLSGLTGGDVQPAMSVSGLGPGSYELEPDVAVPPALQWISSDPEAVRVLIRRAESPPAATPERPLP